MKGMRTSTAPGMEVEGIAEFNVNGKIVRIPIGPDGTVPTWALAMRFQEVGDIDDLEDRPEVVLPAKCTPDEILDWWLNPSSCDVEGIDTNDSPIYDVSSIRDPEKKEIQRRIAVVDADPDEQARVRRVLSENFSTEELRQMASNGSFVIRIVPNMGGATGCYYRRQDGIEIPLVVLEKGNTPDNMTHEMVHHLRTTDRGGILETKLSGDSGLLSSIMDRLPRKRRDMEDEERLTVAETMVRTGIDPVQSGYYDDVPGKAPRKAYIEDLYTLTDTPPSTPPEKIPHLTGKAARDAVLHGYAYTNIARAQILSKDVRKRT